MTSRHDLKRIIRDRQRTTGESNTTARAHVMRERSNRLGITEEPTTAGPTSCEVGGPFEAVVLEVNQQSILARIFGEQRQVTFRTRDVWDVVSGTP